MKIINMKIWWDNEDEEMWRNNREEDEKIDNKVDLNIFLNILILL